MSTSVKLTDEQLWDTVWEGYALPQVIKSAVNPGYIDRLDELFHRYLPVDNKLSMIELGCAPGRWLHYFANEFQYKANGLESSQYGIEITKKNLNLLGVNVALDQADLLTYSPDRQFDVVFSFGLVEHFSPPFEAIQKHLELAKSGGLVVIGVPNLKKAIYGFCQKIIEPQILKAHVNISPEELRDALHDSIDIYFCDYVGVLNFFLLYIPASKRLAYKAVFWVQVTTDKIVKALRIKRESRFFSPYIFIIGRKKH